MDLLKNRHVKGALLVSPVLAVLSYVAVDRIVSERPEAAAPGRSYPLAQKPSCRYPSGICVLDNGDVEIRIRARRLSPDEVELSVSSELPISHALVAVGSGESFSPPVELAGSGTLTGHLEISAPDRESLRWAITILGTAYFSETPAVFVDRETISSGEADIPARSGRQ